jgi:hypothetical protein
MRRMPSARTLVISACLLAASLFGAAIVTAHGSRDKVQVLAKQINDRKC